MDRELLTNFTGRSN